MFPVNTAGGRDVFALINGATSPTRNSGFRWGGARGRAGDVIA